MSICFDIIPNRGFWGLINSPMFWELKSNDHLKIDGQNCCALLLGLRNDFCLQHKKSSGTLTDFFRMDKKSRSSIIVDTTPGLLFNEYAMELPFYFALLA